MNIVRGHIFTQRLTLAIKRAARRFAGRQLIQVLGNQEDHRRHGLEAVYVLNLDRQPARWAHVMSEARRLKTERGRNLFDLCHRISAVDARSLVQDEVLGTVTPTYSLEAQYFVDPDPRLLNLLRSTPVRVSMSNEEVAVALSHVKAWRRIVDEGRSNALILEDDVFFESDFAPQLNRSWTELPTTDTRSPAFDMLYLSFREVDRGAHTTPHSPNLVRLVRGVWWLSGYVLSLEGATKLLDALPVEGPVDLWMNHQFANLHVFASPKSVISQRMDFPSDNRYSILPLLSHIGVQSDKTHLLLEQTRGRRPIFALGFHEESAEVLDAALSLLGYRCCNDRWGFMSPIVGQFLELRKPLLFDAYISVASIAALTEQVRQMYPDAVFIIPHERDRDHRLSSESHRRIASLATNRHAVMCWSHEKPREWGPLCKFLGCEIPSHRFPNSGPPERIPSLLRGDTEIVAITNLSFTVQQHDVHPWIVPYQRIADYGLIRRSRTHGTRAGSFRLIDSDRFSSVDESKWDVMEGTFPSNRAHFRRENLVTLPSGGCRLRLDARGAGTRTYAAASLVSKASFRFGRFAATIKPARVPGLITAFFVHRNDPWQEIDLELLGRDTSKVLLNVYFNPGDPGTACNFGARGAPVTVDLPFDAADDFHEYAIEWEPHEIRWFVDDRLIHARGDWEPTPIPNLPMNLFCSIWPPCSAELAGDLNASSLPVSSDLRRIRRWDWTET